MYNLIAKVTVGGKVFTNVGSVKITSSVEDFMSTATLIVPQVERGSIQIGDEVNVELGYEGFGLNQEFYGKVREISPASPYEIRCADPFQDLRRVLLQRSFIRQPIDKILKTMLTPLGYTVDCDPLAGLKKSQVSLSNIVTDSYTKPYMITIAKAIQNLALKEGYFAFFGGKRLHFRKRDSELIGLLTKSNTAALYQYGKNVIENSLLYNEGNSIHKVTVYSQSPGGIYLKGSAENKKAKGKQERAYDFSGFGSDPQCSSRARELIQELNSPGYRGDFKTFGYPYVRAGQFCGLQMEGQKSPVIQVIKKCDVTFDSGGFRRVITPMSTPKEVYDLNKVSKALEEFNPFARFFNGA